MTNKKEYSYKENSNKKYSRTREDIKFDFNDLNKWIQSSILTSANTLQKAVSNIVSSKPEKKITISKNPELCVQKPQDSFYAGLLKVLGFILFWIGAISVFGGFVSAIGSGAFLMNLLPPLLWGGAFLGLGLLLFTKGKKQKDLNTRYFKYLREIDDNPAKMVDELAIATQQSEQETVKDLKELIDKDYFHQARLVENDEMLILDRATYQLYKESRDKKMYSNIIYVEEEETGNTRLESMLIKGRDYFSKIEILKRRLKNEEFLSKVSRTELLTANIFKRIKEKPELATSTEKFVDYYLPTTIKLLEAYIEAEETSSFSDQLAVTKKEINESFDTINSAYNELLDQLYEDKRLDIKTDISVLETMLRQEGLIEDDISRKDR